jgi:hypothetical protein
MSEIVWQTEHSVETIASPGFAWAYMTDVNHWDDPPAQFRLDGPFVTGAHGMTEIPGQPSRSWRLRDVQPNDFYIMEFALDRAIFSCSWRFRGLPYGGTCLTQHIALEGENAAAYIAEVQPAFKSNLAAGMKKIAMTLDRAYNADRHKKEMNDSGTASPNRPRK